MTIVQWVVLAVAVGIVIVVYVYTRRDKRAMHRHSVTDGPQALLPPRERQLDIFNGQFDEFGVGKPRRVVPAAGSAPATTRPSRIAPSIGANAPASTPTARPAAAAGPDRPAASTATETSAPRQPHSRPEPQAASPGPAEPKKIVSLLLAERSGAQIEGTRLHAVLQEMKLEYGVRQIYHRLYNGETVFSVANLVKPGVLDPEQAAEFQTPGLMLFMVLPGPQQPSAAIHDMLITAGRLAQRLNGQVYDAQREILTPEKGRALQLEVEAWAAENVDG